MSTQKLDYQPLVLVETEDLTRDEWLEYRRQGIGGSDAAAVLGVSPFRTCRDLFYDKLNISTEDDETNWVAKEMGHLLEDLVARIFAQKTGCNYVGSEHLLFGLLNVTEGRASAILKEAE